ncbi:unnamed protein product [Phaeothamnion confervicola]
MVNMLASRMLGRGPDGAEADVPLKGVSVRVTIVDFMAEVELCQRYRNNGRSDGAAVEATYTFPLDSEGALTRCELSVDGRRVLAVVREKQEAKQSYDAAVAVGYAAALVEEDEAMPDVFSCAVGNIPAGAEAEVRITYITTLAADDTERRPRLRFTLPTAVAPRYFPAGSNGSNCGSNGGSSYGAVSGSGGYGETDYRLDVDVSARLASAITSMSSPTHPLTAEQCSAGDGVAVAATCFWRNLKLDGDLVLLLGCAEGHQPRAWLTAPLPDGSRAVAVALVPDLVGVDFDNESAGEFLFVLDRSGSMSGESIDAARQALIIALASLPLGATFNIVSFGSGFEKLFPAGSAAFNDESKAAATAVVAAMEADMGGTEILRPLKDIMDTPPDPARPRQVIVLTDGQVGNTRELVDFVREAHRRTGVRFFAAGVGSGVSHALVNGIARGGGGAAEFIADARGEAVQTKMMRLVGRALQPTITGAVVDYGSLPVSRTAPRRPPPIYAGTRTLLFGLLRPSEAASAAVFGGASVTVRMQGPDGEIVQMVRLMQPWDGDADADAGAVASRLLHACAVRVMLRDLEDDEEAENAGGAAGAHEGADSAKACKCTGSGRSALRGGGRQVPLDVVRRRGGARQRRRRRPDLRPRAHRYGDRQDERCRLLWRRLRRRDSSSQQQWRSWRRRDAHAVQRGTAVGVPTADADDGGVPRRRQLFRWAVFVAAAAAAAGSYDAHGADREREEVQKDGEWRQRWWRWAGRRLHGAAPRRVGRRWRPKRPARRAEAVGPGGSGRVVVRGPAAAAAGANDVDGGAPGGSSGCGGGPCAPCGRLPQRVLQRRALLRRRRNGRCRQRRAFRRSRCRGRRPRGRREEDGEGEGGRSDVALADGDPCGTTRRRLVGGGVAGRRHMAGPGTGDDGSGAGGATPRWRCAAAVGRRVGDGVSAGGARVGTSRTGGALAGIWPQGATLPRQARRSAAGGVARRGTGLMIFRCDLASFGERQKAVVIYGERRGRGKGAKQVIRNDAGGSQRRRHALPC